MIELIRHPYKYFPYELELSRREVATLIPDATSVETKRGIQLSGEIDLSITNRLVYFAGASDGIEYLPTLQSKLEKANGGHAKRQATRYSAHGLHEYKGKFNPQIARAMLNILDVPLGGRVIDPFCGSGTSLLECAHLGMNAVGTDINPLAVYIANAKLNAVKVPVDVLREQLNNALKRFKSGKPLPSKSSPERDAYLLAWFDRDVFDEIERLRMAIEEPGSAADSSLLTLASNLLRDYSQQDPIDLRIRRRTSPLPDKSFIDAFEEAAEEFLEKLAGASEVLKKGAVTNQALLLDSRDISLSKIGGGKLFDCALTSPPYATALPYIDTQRLSLVWLQLIPASQILPLEARLVGSREVRGGKNNKTALEMTMEDNSEGLPAEQANYCLTLKAALGEGDGFRRKAVPLLLYRYFADMAKVFRSIKPMMKKGAPFALIVGGNHSVLGGKRFDIDTPFHLAEIARGCGWSHAETVPLQTYQRYGYHTENAVTAEGMVIVRSK